MIRILTVILVLFSVNASAYTRSDMTNKELYDLLEDRLDIIEDMIKLNAINNMAELQQWQKDLLKITEDLRKVPTPNNSNNLNKKKNVPDKQETKPNQ